MNKAPNKMGTKSAERTSCSPQLRIMNTYPSTVPEVIPTNPN